MKDKELKKRLILLTDVVLEHREQIKSLQEMILMHQEVLEDLLKDKEEDSTEIPLFTGTKEQLEDL